MSQPTLQETVVTFDELAAKRMGRIRRYLRTHPRLVVIGAVVIYLLLTLPGVLAALLYRRRAPMTVIILVFIFECLALVIAGPQGGLGGVGMIIALYTVATSYSAKRTIPLSILAGSFQTVLMVLMGFPDMEGMELDPSDGIDEAVFSRIIIGISGSFVIGFYIAAAAVGIDEPDGE